MATPSVPPPPPASHSPPVVADKLPPVEGQPVASDKQPDKLPPVEGQPVASDKAYGLPTVDEDDSLDGELFPKPDATVANLDKRQRLGFLRGRYLSAWRETQGQGRRFEPPPADYRDQLPPSIEQVVLEYADVVKDGSWTFGLFDMWGKRAKVAKAAVHIPCWEAFTWLPWNWRGLCFGRTCNECYMTGVDRMRWSRTTLAAGLGREYTWGLSKLPGAQRNYLARIRALCLLECCITEAASAGFGQLVAPGGCILNFAACYDCHAREKIRRKFDLPPTFGLPPGIDDCCTHFLCMYCATHQEARELAVRGIDGPGLHILDVLPGSFKHLEGWKEAVAKRADLRAVLAKEIGEFQGFEKRIARDVKQLATRIREARKRKAARLGVAPSEVSITTEDLETLSLPSETSAAGDPLGGLGPPGKDVEMVEAPGAEGPAEPAPGGSPGAYPPPPPPGHTAAAPSFQQMK